MKKYLISNILVINFTELRSRVAFEYHHRHKLLVLQLKSNKSDLEEMKRRFDIITTLMMELQSYGYPPEELVGEAPPGRSTDPQIGLPKVDDGSKAAEFCSLM
uniref:Peroxin-19 n=1 Tax=Onchocerca volvulus TaxID=6282 RepID=A0A8R1U0Z7_ONCVO